ncbi:MAG: family 78 glycoside hydrolase catalytic domain [Gemmatimonadales bacterium]
MMPFLALMLLLKPGLPSSPARAAALRVEHLAQPLGVDAEHPRFSWQMLDSRRGARQREYRLLVATMPERLEPGHADMWDTGPVPSGASLEISYQGTPLQPRHRYYWTVCIRDARLAAAPCAAPEWFETGMMSEPWQAHWIAGSLAPLDTLPRDPLDATGMTGGSRPPLLRRSFTLRARPVSARIFIAALGGYRLHINGVTIPADAFTPDWTDYRDRITYQTFDVTSVLRPGPNALGLLLGAGWYASRIGFSPRRYNFGPPPVRAMVELHVRYTDGSEEVIASDTTWRTAPSAVLFSEIYDGEWYDARLESPGWDRAAFDDREWAHAVAAPAPAGRLQTQAMALIRAVDSIVPVMSWSPAPGVRVFDLGQNIAGWARLHVRGPAGAHVRLRFAEILGADSNISQINLRTAKATDVYILRGGQPETFEPHFTYHGFRYVEVTGYPGNPRRSDVVGIVVHTALPETGELVTSDRSINRLWDNILWTQRANLYSIPTDCPQRDERMGWMGDAQVFWRTASYNMDMSTFGEKWLADVRDGQTAAGCFPNYAPSFLGVLTCGAPGWADAGVIIPWTMWRQYGDTVAIAGNWTAMERYLAFIADSNPDHLWRHGKQVQFGDWLPAGTTTSSGQTNTDLISTAFWAYDARLMAEMARAIGRTDAAARYGSLFRQVRDAFDSAFIKADGRIGAPYTNDDSVHTEFTQTATALALRFGLVPPALRPAAVEWLASDIHAHDGHLTTGFLGSSYLLPVLSDGGRDDVAFELLRKRSFPSWLYEVDHGATTIWERWNGDHGDPEMNSYSHYANGAVGEWLYRYLGGIDETAGATAFDTVLIHPRWAAGLDSAHAVYRSVRGTIVSSWHRRADGAVLVTVTIPANTAGVVELPAAADRVAAAGIRASASTATSSTFPVGAGSYRFEVRPGR